MWPNLQNVNPRLQFTAPTLLGHLMADEYT
ncbi:hypothetical protein J2X73_001932 [Novosphingobium sp. 1748]|nr:hypothetical protein [Novosphingobium sp. 1748]NKI98076.1 hypothetical protein [Novosphingobium sp. SG707]